MKRRRPPLHPPLPHSTHALPQAAGPHTARGKLLRQPPSPSFFRALFHYSLRLHRNSCVSLALLHSTQRARAPEASAKGTNLMVSVCTNSWAVRSASAHCWAVSRLFPCSARSVSPNMSNMATTTFPASFLSCNCFCKLFRSGPSSDSCCTREGHLSIGIGGSGRRVRSACCLARGRCAVLHTLRPPPPLQAIAYCIPFCETCDRLWVLGCGGPDPPGAKTWFADDSTPQRPGSSHRFEPTGGWIGHLEIASTTAPQKGPEGLSWSACCVGTHCRLCHHGPLHKDHFGPLQRGNTQGQRNSPPPISP